MGITHSQDGCGTKPKNWDPFGFSINSSDGTWRFLKMGGTPFSPIFRILSYINHPFLGIPHLWQPPHGCSSHGISWLSIPQRAELLGILSSVALSHNSSENMVGSFLKCGESPIAGWFIIEDPIFVWMIFWVPQVSETCMLIYHGSRTNSSLLLWISIPSFRRSHRYWILNGIDPSTNPEFFCESRFLMQKTRFKKL